MGRRLEGKHCVITGGAGSLGLACAHRFVEEGARVVLVDCNAEALEAAQSALPSPQIHTVLADVGDSDSVANYIVQSVARFGPIDVLFSNAGNDGPILPVTDYPLDMFDRIHRVHVRGTFLALKHGIPQVRDGGSIIVTSSVVGVMGVPGNSAYVSAKHALIGLVRSVAKDVAERGIRVNTVNPGPVDNALMRAAEAQMSAASGMDAAALFNSMIPLGRHAAPAEVANAALYLASDESSYMTGSMLMVDGGMHA
jgi:NAD(P)-dependent dehydrogenase (short-subunit alcohol dehydrogenase family)